LFCGGQSRDADDDRIAMTIPERVKFEMIFQINVLAKECDMRKTIARVIVSCGIEVALELAESQRIRDLPTRRRNHEFASGL
jgi:hypothetical protein